jgi:hypothetical protein
MDHGRPSGGHAGVIERHRDGAAKYLQRRAIPVFDHFMICGEAGVDERTMRRSFVRLLATTPQEYRAGFSS